MKYYLLHYKKSIQLHKEIIENGNFIGRSFKHYKNYNDGQLYFEIIDLENDLLAGKDCFIKHLHYNNEHWYASNKG